MRRADVPDEAAAADDAVLTWLAALHGRVGELRRRAAQQAQKAQQGSPSDGDGNATAAADTKSDGADSAPAAAVVVNPYVDSMSERENVAVAQLRRRLEGAPLAEQPGGSILDLGVACLLRFVRARGCDVEKARR